MMVSRRHLPDADAGPPAVADGADAAAGASPRVDALLGLARAAGAGDRAAAHALLQAVGPLLMRTLRAMMGPRHPDFEDALQESLVGLVRALPSFRGECTVAHFAVRVAMRKATDARLRYRRAAARDQPLEELDLAGHTAGSSPGASALSGRQRALLDALLGELPELQSEALTLKIVLGYSVEEIAAATGVPLNTVRSRLRLAKDALRTWIEQRPEFAELREVSE